MPNTILHTQRLTLRTFDTTDALFLARLLNTPGWIEHIGDAGVHTLDQAREYICARLKPIEQTHGFGLWCVCLNDDARTSIGMCGLIKRQWLDDVDLGFAILPDYQRHGFAKEASLGVITYAKERLDIERLAAITSPNNIPSQHLLKQLGFSHQGKVLSPKQQESILFILNEMA